MGLKKKGNKKKRDVAAHAHGPARLQQILDIVATDNTFEPILASASAYERGPHGEIGWKGRCLHCSAAIYVGCGGLTNATIEHIVPTSAGGSGTDLRNLALACSACNSEKGVRHDPNYGRNPRSTEIIHKLLATRKGRWRVPVQATA